MVATITLVRVSEIRKKTPLKVATGKKCQSVVEFMEKERKRSREDGWIETPWGEIRKVANKHQRGKLWLIAEDYRIPTVVLEHLAERAGISLFNRSVSQLTVGENQQLREYILKEGLELEREFNREI